MSFEEWYDQHFGSADPGVVQAGNIDLGDRPVVYNEDGSVSTEKSFSIQDDQYGREILLPQVVGGKMLSKKDAIKHYRDTGEHLGIYKDIPTADAYAKSIHERIPRLDTPETFPVGGVMQSIRDLPGWAAYRMYRGATRNDLPGEGPSAREQEAAGGVPNIPPPFFNRDNWSLQNPAKNLRDLKNAILPPGFSVQRGLDSALAPAKWLLNEVRQGILSDDDLAEIKRNPYSPRSMMALAQAGISLSRGEGGERIPIDPKPGAIPEKVWNTFNIAPPYNDPKIKIDNAGNHFEYMGSHEVVDPETGKMTRHVIAKGVEPSAIQDWQEGLKNGDITQEQYDAAVAAIDKGEMPPLPADKGQGGAWLDKYLSPEDKAKYDALDKYLDNPFSKFMGGEGPPPPAEGPPSEPLKPEPGSVLDEWSKKHGGKLPFEPPPPYASEHPVTPEDLSDFYAKHGKPMPPDKPEGYWGNANDRTYSGPLTGQTWADVYATPDVEFTVPPKDPLDSMLSDWAKYMDEKGIDYGQNEPPPVDQGVQKDFDHIEEWWRKSQQNKNRFNWKPPDEHGGNNL